MGLALAKQQSYGTRTGRLISCLARVATEIAGATGSTWPRRASMSTTWGSRTPESAAWSIAATSTFVGSLRWASGSSTRARVPATRSVSLLGLAASMRGTNSNRRKNNVNMDVGSADASFVRGCPCARCRRRAGRFCRLGRDRAVRPGDRDAGDLGWWGRGLPRAPYLRPTRSSQCRWPTVLTSSSPTCDPGGPRPCWACPQPVKGSRESRVYGCGAGASASAPWELSCGPLDGGAGASLCGGDVGHDGVDVTAAAAPGGFSAALATGGTTHVVFLWLVVDYWSTVKRPMVRGRRYLRLASALDRVARGFCRLRGSGRSAGC